MFILNGSRTPEHEVPVRGLVGNDKPQLNQIQGYINNLLSMLYDRCELVEIEFRVITEDPEGIKLYLERKAHKATDNLAGLLSKRELEILGHIMAGKTNKEIASELFLSIDTVKSHRKSILSKTNSRNTAALINHYHQTFFDK